MPDIVLVNPHWYMAEGNLDDLWLPFPSGLASLAVALRAQGYAVTIVDALAEGYDCRKWIERNGRRLCRVGLPEEVLVEKLMQSRARVVGIGNMFTAVFSGAVECASAARRALPSARLIMGGVHPSCTPEEVAGLPEVDYVLCGEGEVVLPNLMRYLEGAADSIMPPGVYWRESGGIRNSGPAQPIMDLDALPSPAYDLLDMQIYRSAAETDLISRGEKGAFTMPIISSRGCPYGCIFCAVHRLNGRRWRGRAPAKVVDEIELLQKRYGVNSFTIEDSNFTYEEDRAIAICNDILRRGLHIRWNTPNGLRADRITPRLIDAMKQAGCYEITMAAEHGDQKFLNRVIRKGLDLESIFRAGAIIRKAGLSVACFLMMGFPGETPRELEQTVRFGRRLARAGILPLFFICSPLPGTVMYQAFVAQGDLPAGTLSPDDYLCSLRLPVMKAPAGMDLPRQRHRAMWQAYGLFLWYHPVAFFRLPAIRKLLQSLTSPRQFGATVKKLYNQFVR